ncbi:peptidylprolyl isomerase [Sphingomonas sp.]|uniref:peptidylprolyl isomerase n=1 Tax=Sphingomonas sp. TaxID=28214 RepID=UPI003B3B6DAA
MVRSLVASLLLLAVAPANAAPAPLPKVAIVTSEGTIVATLEAKRAPITTANFLRYVDAKRFDNTTFYRAARSKRIPGKGLVQGGINHNIPKSFLPIKHEPTTVTGLRHVDGTLSMARNAVNSAMGDFFITVGPAPDLDARPSYPGYAAFGHVVSGMDVAKKILAKPTYPGGFDEYTIGQIIRQPVKIITVRRIR